MSCNNAYKSVDAGTAGCMFKYATKMLMFPPKKDDGTDWSFADYSAITSTSITAAVNAANAKDRIYPTPKFGKYTPAVSDPAMEETAITSIVLDEGKYSFDIEIMSDEGADQVMAAAINTHQGDDVWMVDKYGKLYAYVDTDGKTLLPIPTDMIKAQFKNYDLEGTTTQKVVVKVVLSNTVDLERLVTVSADTLGFNMNSIDPTAQISKMFSSYEFVDASTVSVFLAAGRYQRGATGFETADVSGVIVSGASLTGVALADDTTKGAGWYTLTFTEVITAGQILQFTWSKTGFNTDDINTKLTPAYSA